MQRSFPYGECSLVILFFSLVESTLSYQFENSRRESVTSQKRSHPDIYLERKNIRLQQFAFLVVQTMSLLLPHRDAQ